MLNVFSKFIIPFLLFASCNFESTEESSTGLFVNHKEVENLFSFVPPANGLYQNDDKLNFILKHPGVITVTGTPRIPVNINGTVYFANYVSGSGSKSLTFTYTIPGGLVDNDGINVASLIDLNGGTLTYKNKDTAVNADRKIPSKDLTGVLVSSTDYYIDTVSAVAETTHITNDNLSFNLNLAQVGVVTGTPRVALDINGETKYADYQSGSNSNTLVFTYVVESGLEDLNGVEVLTPLDLNGGTLKSTGGEDFSLHFVEPSLPAVLVDSVGGLITSISPPADNTYVIDDNMDFTVNFDKAVNITGTPQLTINIDYGGPIVADYFSGTGTSAIVFRYTVEDTVGDETGVLLVSPLGLNGGTIIDAAGNYSIDLSFTLPNTAGVKIESPIPTVTIDGPASNIIVANKASYSLSGTCSVNGNDVVVNIGAHTVSPAPVCTALAWSISGYDISSISDSASVSITADHDSNVPISAEQATTSVIKDTVAPVITFTSAIDINQANVATYTLSGTCLADDEGKTVSLLADGTLGINATCLSSAWTTAATDMSSLADNASLTITANMTDAVGNPAAEASTNIIKDTVAPTISITSPTDNSYVNIANDSTTFAISGNCSEAGQTVTIKVDASSAASQVGFSCNGTTFSGTIDTTGISEASHTFSATITDTNGNSTTSSNINFIRDVTKPVLAISSSPTIYSGNYTAYAVSGTCLDPDDEGLNATVLIGGSVSKDGACASGVWTASSIDTTSITDDPSVSLTVNMTDAAGNPAVEVSTTVIKDIVAPSLTLDNPANSSYINIASNSATFSADGTCDENTAVVNIKIDGSDASSQSDFVCNGTTYSGTFDTTGLAEGSRSIVAVVSDSNGNETTTSANIVIKDITKPVLAISSSPTIFSGNYTAYAVSGTCLDPDDEALNATVLIGGSVSKDGACASGVWTASSIDTTSIADNPSVSLTVNMTDAAGNAADEVSTNIVKDIVAPSLTLDTPANSSYINIASNSATFAASGTCDENTAVVNIKIDGSDATSQSGFVCNGTTYSGTLDTTGLAEGSRSFVAILSDASGNETTTAANVVVKDITRPNVSSVSIADARLLNGDNFDIDVDFDEAVNFTGSPKIDVGIGSNTRNISYNSGDGTSSSVFRYLLTDSDYDLDLVDFSSTTVDLNGGTINDLAGNALDDNSFTALTSKLYVLPDSAVSWYDADDSATLFTDDGCTTSASATDTVGCWKNKYDNSNNATQATAGDKPTLTASQINGKPALVFNNDEFSNAVNFNAQTVFIVFKGADQAQLVWGDHDNDLGVEFERTDILGIITRTYNFGGSCGNGCASKWAHNDEAESTYTATALSWEVDTWNRLFLETEAAGGANLLVHRIGSSNFDGSIAEILIFDDALSANAKAAVHAYLNTKYGI